MTLEAILKSIAAELKRTADAIEAALAAQGVVPEQAQLALSSKDDDDLDEPEEEAEDDDDLDEEADSEEEADDLDDDLDEEETDDDLDDDDLDEEEADDDLDDDEPPKRASKKKASKKKTSKKKTSTKKASKKKTSKKTSAGAPTVEDVRAALQEVQKKTGSPAKAKALLKRAGASNLKTLDPKKYAAVIKAAKAA